MILDSYFELTEDTRTGRDGEQGVSLACLHAAHRLTDSLFDLVTPEGLAMRPVPERHRLLFYLGHLEAFDWNLILRGHFESKSFQPEWDRLFAFGIDPAAGHLPDEPLSSWPEPERIRRYNRMVREDIAAVWGATPTHLKHIAIEHRLMHAETLTYLLHNLDFQYKRSPVGEYRGKAHAARVVPSFVPIAAGDAWLGAADEEGFGWDNEFDGHRVAVGSFEAARYKVTNAEYLRFVSQGGGTPSAFWTQRDGEWCWRGMFGLTPLQADAPVYLTLTQARAYASWAGARLPTEAEWHRYSEGAAAVRFADAVSGVPLSVDACPEADSVYGVAQPFGNGWEWTSTRFAPFAGFRAYPEYPGYSADFFDEQHYVLKGASPATPGKLLRASFRNWFRPDYRYVYATCRLVRD
jgi:formylglycine-generating enzyme required for sulfatase activity